MAKIKYDVTGVESKGDRPVPKPGVYRCKIISCVDAKPENKDRRLEVQYEILEGDSKGYRLYDYIVFSEASEWKLAQFIRACGLPDKGALDPDKLVGVAINVRTRVENSEQYGTSAKPASLMPLDGDDDDDEDLSEDEEDTDVDDGDEEESEDEDEDDESEDDDESEEDEEDEDEDWTEDELKELDTAALKEEAFNATDDEDNPGFGLDKKKFLKKKGDKKVLDKPKVIKAILEAQEAKQADDEADDEDEKAEAEDYSKWSEKKLKAELKEREIKLKGAYSKSKAVKALKADDEEDPF